MVLTTPGQRFGVSTQCRFTGGVHLTLRTGGKLRAHGVEICFDVFELFGAQHILKNIKTVLEYAANSSASAPDSVNLSGPLFGSASAAAWPSCK